MVQYGRTMIGATNPLASAPGTIRGDFGIDVGRNIVHGSDSVEVRAGLGVCVFGGDPIELLCCVAVL